MAGDTVEVAYYELRGKLDGLKTDLATADKMVGKSATTVESKFSKVGGTLTKTLTPAAAGFSAFALSAFKDFDAGADALRAGTGKTGAALDDLEQSFKTVAGDVTTDLETVGTTMAELAKRTKLTGDPLEELTQNVIELQELGQNVTAENVSRFLAAWDIGAEDASDSLDMLFRTSQETGAGVEDLASLLSKNGRALQGFGFDVEDSTALLGSFEAAGLDTRKSVASLRVGLANLSQDTENVPAAFDALIASIAGAGSEAEGNKRAIEVFGSRAGPDLAAAIREGRFELKDMRDAIANGSDTIRDAREDTDDWTDKLIRLKNQAKVIVGPIGEVGFAIGGIAAGIGPAALGIGKMIEKWRAYRVASEAAAAADAAGILPGLSRTGLLASEAAAGTGKLVGTLKGVGALAGTYLIIDKIADSIEHAKEEASDDEIHDALDELVQDFDEGKIKAHDFTLAYDELRGSLKTTEFIELSDKAADLFEAQESVRQSVSQLGDEMPAIADDFDRTGAKVEWTGRKFDGAGEKIVEFAGLTGAELKDWKTGTVEGLNSVDDALDELADKHNLTADQIIKAFDKQLSAMRDYQDNWETVVKRSGGRADGLLQHLQDMGIEGASVVEALAGANDKQFAKIIAKWNTGQKEAGETSGKVAGIGTSINNLPGGKSINFETPGLQLAVDNIGKLRDQLAQLGAPAVLAVQLQHLAKGGPVEAGVPYVVGEHGPELFVSQVPGGIIPNHAISRGSSGGTQRIEGVLHIPGIGKGYIQGEVVSHAAKSAARSNRWDAVRA